jgi:hypothetical protein
VLDAIAYEDTQLAGYDSLATGGGMALTLGEAPSVKAKREAEKDSENKSVVGFLANAHLPGQNEIGTKIHESLGDWLAKGTIIVSGVSFMRIFQIRYLIRDISKAEQV